MPNKTDSKINLPVPDTENISDKNGRLEVSEILKLQELEWSETQPTEEPLQLSLFELLDPLNSFKTDDCSGGEVSELGILQGNMRERFKDWQTRRSLIKEINENSRLEESDSAQFRVKADSALYLAAFLLDPASREAVLGDMEEKFHDCVKSFGAKKSIRILRRDVIISILVSVKEVCRSKMIRLLISVGVYKIYKYFIG